MPRTQDGDLPRSLLAGVRRWVLRDQRDELPEPMNERDATVELSASHASTPAAPIEADPPLARPEIDGGIDRARVRAEVRRRLIGAEDDEAIRRIGRFQILRRLGQGGMGIVYAAYDDELDRKVALKLIREEGDEGHQARMRREAQALAKLSHPNVVPVYEVGTHAGDLFIAMEFVRGETLRHWAKQGQRPWSEVVEIYAQAGRGLAAAHAAGLVHRDFKPDNAMLGNDGRVRVLDFGLVRLHGQGSAVIETVMPSRRDSELEAELTAEGALMGTPAYMAPEQFLGEPVDARTDQFAFAVALYEAVYGRRPFSGNDRWTLAAAVTGGRVEPPPRARDVPKMLRGVLLRALDPDPARRYPDMPAFLAALDATRARRRRNRILGGVALLVVAAAGIVGVRSWQDTSARAACRELGDTIDEVWNEEARTRLRDGMLATGVPFAQATADVALPYFEARAEEWRTSRTDACLAATVDHTMAEGHGERARWCLEHRRLEIDALARQLAVSDAGAVERAVGAAAGLPEVASCLDDAVLANMPPPPPADKRDEAAQVQQTLAEARAMHVAGRYADAVEVARLARDAAEALDYVPLLAAAHAAEGASLAQSGAFEDAGETERLAYRLAAKARAWNVAAPVAADLVVVVGNKLARHEEGLLWAEQAEVAIALAGDPLGLRGADLDEHVALVLKVRGDLDGAAERAHRALAIKEDVLGPNHPIVATAMATVSTIERRRGNVNEAVRLSERSLAIEEASAGPDHPRTAYALGGLAIAIKEQGDLERAEALLKRSLQITERALGPDHPAVANCLDNLGNVIGRRGDLETAKEYHLRALAVREKTLGPEHIKVATALFNLGQSRAQSGDYEGAQADFKRALPILEKRLGPDHPDVAAAVDALGHVLAILGDREEAVELLQRALATREKALGPEHPELATLLSGLAHVYVEDEDYERAEPLYARAVAITEKTRGKDHPFLAFTLMGVADVAMGRGDYAKAIESAERAVAIAEVAQGDAILKGYCPFVLAKALWSAPVDAGRDRERAMALATRAREVYLDAQPDDRSQRLAEIEQWIAQRS